MTSTHAVTADARQAQTNLLAQPHHDGSALSVSNLRPQLGDTVRFRVRVPHRAGAAHAPIQVSTRHLSGVAGVQTAYGRDLIQSGESVTLTADVPEVNIWTWPRA